MIQAPNFIALMAIQFLGTLLGGGSALSITMSFIADCFAKHARENVVNQVNVAGVLAVLLGSCICPVIVEASGLRGPFFVCAGFSIIAGFAAYTFLIIPTSAVKEQKNETQALAAAVTSATFLIYTATPIQMFLQEVASIGAAVICTLLPLEPRYGVATEDLGAQVCLS